MMMVPYSALFIFVLVGTMQIPTSCLGLDCMERDDIQIFPPSVRIDQPGDAVHFTCISEFTDVYPLWEINGNVYEVTHLPNGFTATGKSLRFPYQVDANVRCFFKILDDESVVDICSNMAMVTGVIREGNSYAVCNSQNVSFSIQSSASQMNVFMEDNDNCNVFVHECNDDREVSNCSANVNGMLTTFECDTSEILRDNVRVKISCDSCGETFIIHNFKPTEQKVIKDNDEELTVDNISGGDCTFSMNKTLMGYKICVYSEGSSKCNGPCDRDAQVRLGSYCNETAQSSMTLDLEVNGIKNGTVVSLFCWNKDCENEKPSNVMAANIQLLFCDDCPENAECKNGMCKCKDGYKGDGMKCNDASVMNVNPLTLGLVALAVLLVISN